MNPEGTVVRIERVDTVRCVLFAIVASGVIAGSLLSGCGVCGRQIVFDLVVKEPGGHEIDAATIEAACVDLDGSIHRAGATSGVGGKRYFRVTAPERPCPEDPERIASYFARCTVTASAPGFTETTIELTGEQMDALAPPEDFQDGNHVPLTITLLP